MNDQLIALTMTYVKPQLWTRRSIDMTVVLTSKSPFKSIDATEKDVRYALLASGIDKDKWKEHGVSNTSLATKEIVLCHPNNNIDFTNASYPTWWKLDKFEIKIPDMDTDSYMYSWSICLADMEKKSRTPAVPTSEMVYNKTIFFPEYTLRNKLLPGRNVVVTADEVSDYPRQGQLSDKMDDGTMVVDVQDKTKKKNISLYIGSPLHYVLEERQYSVQMSDFSKFKTSKEDGEDRVLVCGNEDCDSDELQYLVISAVTDDTIKFYLNKAFDCTLLEENSKTGEMDYPIRHNSNGECIALMIPFKVILLFVTWMKQLSRESGVVDVRNKQLLLLLNKHYDYNMSRPRPISVHITYRIAKYENEWRDGSQVINNIQIPKSVFCADNLTDEDDTRGDDVWNSSNGDNTVSVNDDYTNEDDEDSDSGLLRWQTY